MKNYINVEGKEIKLSDETIKEFKKALKIEEEILVPDYINIKSCPGGDGLGIMFNNDNQRLGYYNGYYNVDSIDNKVYLQCKLTPCKREDLKAGDTAYFWHNDTNVEFKNINLYCKILNKTEHAFVNNEIGI